MAKDKKGFILYCDIIHTIEKLSDEQAGKLFKHILRYVNDKEPVAEDVITEIAFEPIKQSLKRDLQKYENIRLKNKENALKRWNATASDGMQVDAKNAVIVKDRVKDKDIYIPTFIEFLKYAIEQVPNINKEEVRLKYESWKVNNWCTNVQGKERKIKNWKTTLLNTLPYIRKDNSLVYTPPIIHE